MTDDMRDKIAAWIAKLAQEDRILGTTLEVTTDNRDRVLVEVSQIEVREDGRLVVHGRAIERTHAPGGLPPEPGS